MLIPHDLIKFFIDLNALNKHIGILINVIQAGYLITIIVLQLPYILFFIVIIITVAIAIIAIAITFTYLVMIIFTNTT